MVKGHELGLSLSASFEFISVIQGKPVLSPRGALALVLQSELLENLKIEDLTDATGTPTSCKVTMRRRGGFEYTTQFSMADAKRAGLVKSGSAWETFPANMLRWRAVGYCIDVAFPDVIGGMKRADEFGANLDSDGNVIEGQWKPAPAPAPVQVPPQITLQMLVDGYGAEAVMAANGGQIPVTPDEIATTAATLDRNLAESLMREMAA